MSLSTSCSKRSCKSETNMYKPPTNEKMDGRILKATISEVEEARVASENKVKLGPFFYNVVKIHSRAKMGSDAAYCSNFTPLFTPLIIDGKEYISVEHYYQSQKFEKEDQREFECGGCVADAKQAKSVGSKGGMKKFLKKRNKSYSLDMNEWTANDKSDHHCIRVMKKALWARYKQDKRFRDIINKPFTIFEHYEKRRGKFSPDRVPVWGCYLPSDPNFKGKKFGLNIMGCLMNEIAFFHHIPNYFEYTISEKKYLSWSGNVVAPMKHIYPREGISCPLYVKNGFPKLPIKSNHYYYAMNGYGEKAKYEGKPIIFKTQAHGSQDPIPLRTLEVDQLIQLHGYDEKGFCDVGDAYAADVHSPTFKKLCHIGSQ